MKKVLYIHGAFSAFKPESEKVKNLKKDFEVVGTSYSMEETFDYNVNLLSDYCKKESVDFVVGTSLGGLFAAELNSRLGLDAVLINPCVEPKMSLTGIIGTQKNYTTGKEETLTKELVSSYPELANVSENCLLFVGLKDVLIDANKTVKLYEATSKVVLDENEDHYWEEFSKNEEIKEYFKFV